MGPVFVVVSPLVTDDFPGMGQIPKPVLVQALISEASIEAFDKAVLSRLSRLDQLQLNSVVISPLVQGLAGERYLKGALVHAKGHGVRIYTVVEKKRNRDVVPVWWDEED